MPDTGWIIAAAGVNDTGKGSEAWSNPGNVTANDGTTADVTITNLNESNWLRSSHDFENLLPIDSVITGVEVRVQIGSAAGSVERVIEVQLHNGTVFIGTAKTPNETIPDTPTDLDFGGSEDLWDAVLNLVQIGFCNLPVQFAVRVDSDVAFGGTTVTVDATWMKLHYLAKDQWGNLKRAPGGFNDVTRLGRPGQFGDFIGQ